MAQNDETLLRRVDQYLHELDELIALVGDKQFLTAEEKRLAQEKLKVLKERMKGDTDYGVCKAILHFHAAWNTNPINSNWLQQIGVVSSDLNLYRDRLQRKPK
jgi:hypothetical protein